MDFRTLKILWLTSFGLLVGLLTTVTSESPCDASSQFVCRSDPTICISLMRVRDGSADCPDKSDEECNTETEYQCQTIHQCIPKERLHDGWPDCDDGSDEECGRGQHRCRCGLPHCIEGHKVKDGVKDCDDGSDEDDLRNQTARCPDENRLQDLMAIERKRRKRQIDLSRRMKAPSIERILHNAFRTENRRLRAPSVENKERTKTFRSIDPTKSSFKISTETEVYGSLNSGKIYQTAVNEPISSLSVPKYTQHVSGVENGKATTPTNMIYGRALENTKKETSDFRKNTSDKIKKLREFRQFEMAKKNLKISKFSEGSIDESKKYHLKRLVIEPTRTVTVETNRNSDTPMKVLKDESLPPSTGDTVYNKRHLLSLTSPVKKIINHGKRLLRKHHFRRRSLDEETHIPLIFSSSAPFTSQASLHPTGLVTSMTGTDIIDGRTTEWTTLIEGTYISGTYAHVVKSTSKIFYTVTKTLSKIPVPTSTSQSLETTSVSLATEESEPSEDVTEDTITIPTKDFLLPSFRATARVVTSSNTAEQEISISHDHESSINSQVSQPMAVLLSDRLMPSSVPSDNHSDAVKSHQASTHLSHPASIVDELKSSMSTTVDVLESTTDVTEIMPSSMLVNSLTTLNVDLTSLFNDFKVALPPRVLPTVIEHELSPVFTFNHEESTADSANILLQNTGSAVNFNQIHSTLTLHENITSSSEKDELENEQLPTHKPESKDFTDTITAVDEASVLTLENLNGTSIVNVSILPIPSSTRSVFMPEEVNDEKSFTIKETASSLSVVVTETPSLNIKDILTEVTALHPAEDIMPINSDTSYPSELFTNTVSDSSSSIKPTSASSIHDFIPTFTLFSSLDNSDHEDGGESNKVTILESFIFGPSDDTSSKDLPDVTFETTFFDPVPTMIGSIPEEAFVETTKIDASQDSPATEELKRAKRATDGKVTILNPDGRIVTTDAGVVLSPTTHYTTYTYYTTILQPGGGTRVMSQLHIESSVINPSAAVRPHAHSVVDDGHCCDTTDYDGHIVDPLVVRDGDGYVAIPRDDGQITRYYTATQPLDRSRYATYRTTFTYYTTRFEGRTPVVHTRYETETNISPLYEQDVHGFTRRPSVPVRFTNYPAHTYAIDTRLNRPHDITHRTTYTYHTTRFRDGTPVVNTREETETNVTPIPTYYRPHLHTVHREVPGDAIYTAHTHREVPRPDTITRHATYPDRTTVYRDGIPFVTTRERTFVRPFTTYIPQPQPIGVITTHYPTHTRVPYNDHHHDPYITHRTTYTYYTTRFRGGTAVVETRKETETNITPNPTYSLDRATITRHVHPARQPEYTEYYDDCAACHYTEEALPRGRAHGDIDRQTLSPSTVTHFSTYTYATTELPRAAPPRVRTREHTVTEVLSDVILPTLTQPTTTESQTRQYTFGERIRSRRSVSAMSANERLRPTQQAIYASSSVHNPDMVPRSFRRDVNRPQRARATENVPSRDRANHGRRINDRGSNTIAYAQEIKPTRVTFFSTYTYFTTELSDGVPVIRSREHTVTEILSDVIVPTVSRARRPQSLVHHNSRNARDSGDDDGLSRQIYAKRKLLQVAVESPDKLNHDAYENHYIQPTPQLRASSVLPDALLLHPEVKDDSGFKVLDFAEDLALMGAENRAVVATPVTYYTTHTYYSTILKPGGHTSVNTRTEVSSSVYYPTSNNAESRSTETNRTKRKHRRKKLTRSGTYTQRQPTCTDCYVANQRLRPRTSKIHPQQTAYATRVQLPRYPISVHDGHTRNLLGNSYLTSIPVHRMITRLAPMQKRPHQTESYHNPHIRPTHVTYYSTYTYFTTELESGRPVTRSREHTVTELLTNVIVPTIVSAHNNYLQSTRDLYHRGKRNADNSNSSNVTPEDKIFFSALPASDVVTSSATVMEPKTPRNIESETFTKHLDEVNVSNTDPSDASSSKLADVAPQYSTADGTDLNGSLISLKAHFEHQESTFSSNSDEIRSSMNSNPTPSLNRFITDDINVDSTTSRSIKNEFLSASDLQQEGAEVYHQTVAKPITYYTTNTYYTTMLKPGGSRVVETNTKVSTSLYYPLPERNHELVRKEQRIHESRHKPYYHPSPSGNARCTDCQRLDHKPPRAPYRPTFAPKFQGYRHEVAHRRKACPSCEQALGVSHVYKPSYQPQDVQKASYITKLPVRRIPTHTKRRYDKAPNTIIYPAEEVKPTRVTFYSTYTYFTTELNSGRPVVKSREHTVTEVLTDVIVPTVSPVRGKREIYNELLDDDNDDDVMPIKSTSDSDFLPVLMWKGKRKLLGLTEDEDNALSESATNEEFSDTATLDVTKSTFHTNDDDSYASYTEKNEQIARTLNDSTPPTESDVFFLDDPINNDLHEESTFEKEKEETSSNSFPSQTSPITLTADIFNNAQVSKAFSAYLDFLKSSNSSVDATRTHYDHVPTSNDVTTAITTTAKQNTSEVMTERSDVPYFVTPRNMPIEPVKTISEPDSVSDFTSTVTTDVTRNGKITRYTTTIYGTYINGFHAQRAVSQSEVIPLPAMSITDSIDMSPMYSPSRSEGLVSIKVSKVTRGPLAIHFTTEIHGTYVAGAYAQTARVYTSYQRLSATPQKDYPHNRIQSTSSATYSGPRKTGLLSSRVLRTKIDDGTTYLLVSEIHGTHIGGAYAHLGTYVTHTITPTQTIEMSETSTKSLPTYKADEIETGLITASMSVKITNGTTTRYHYEVYGTFLDGTYAHVPSVRKELILPTTVNELPTTLVNTEINSLDEVISATETKLYTQTGRMVPSDSEMKNTSYDKTESLKIGLIEASSRVHVNNGTTTRHIFEVHGTYLNGMYAHVPSVSVEIIQPTHKIEEAPYEEPTIFDNDSSTEYVNGPLYDSDDASSVIDEAPSTKKSLKTGLIEESTIEHVTSGTTTRQVHQVYGTYLDGTYAHVPSIIMETITPSTGSNSADVATSTTASEEFARKKMPSRVTLLPEELRISFSNNFEAAGRSKRQLPVPSTMSYLQSSFTEAIRSNADHYDVITATTPLSNSALAYSSTNSFSQSSRRTIKNITKQISGTEKMSKSVNHSKCDKRIRTYKDIKKETYRKPECKLLRSKRSPATSRTNFGGNKRFGASREARKFGSSSSSTSNRGYSSKQNSGKYSSTRSYSYSPPSKSISISKTMSRSTLSLSTKRPLRFPPRKRDKLVSASSTVSSSSETPAPTTVSSSSLASSNKVRKFGKSTVSPRKQDPVDDFEASEAVIRSVTEQSLPQTAQRARYYNPLRPSKMSKFLARNASNSRRILHSTTQAQQNVKLRPSNFGGFRNRKSKNYRSTEDVQPTSSELSTSSTKKRFTLTTSFYSIKVKPTSSFLSDIDDSDENKLNDDDMKSSKRRSKILSSRRGRGSNLQSSINNYENELGSNKPKTLPLPPFGRSREFKRPATFDPRTLKESTTSSTSTIIYITNSPTPPMPIERADFDEEDEQLTESVPLNTPITVTSIITTTKTLAVHLGLKTSFATITTTAYSTSTIQPDDITVVSRDGFASTVVSTKIGLPDANLPPDKQSTVVTEYLLTTTEVDTTSLLAMKFGYGTRTVAVHSRQILTTLATKINTIHEIPTNTAPAFPQYPYFPNPFIPQLPSQKPDFSFSVSKNSFVSTETLTSTTVLPLLLNGKTTFTTLTSTSVTESIIVETATLKVAQPPQPPPFVFPQPVFILPSVTTEITVHFTAPNGQVLSIVTMVTVPLMPAHGHTRFARSAIEYDQYTRFPDLSNVDMQHNDYENIKASENVAGTDILQSSFSTPNDRIGTLIHKRETTNLDTYESTVPKESISDTKRKKKLDSVKEYNSNLTFKKRKLMQINLEEPEIISSDDNTPTINTFSYDETAALPNDYRRSSAQSGELTAYNSSIGYPENYDLLPPFIFDPFSLGPGYNDDALSRPIPSVRVVPTRRAYVRRIRPGNVQPQPIPEESFRNFPADSFGLPQNYHNFYSQRNPPANPLLSNPLPLSYPDDSLPYPPQPVRPAARRPNFPENNISPQNRRVIRLRRPGNVPQPVTPPDGVLLERKPIVNSPQSNEYIPLRARGPAIGSNISPDQNVRDIADNNLRRPNPERNVFVRNRPVPALPVPLTYYTTFTYMTTFVNGPSTAYSTREAVVSNVATETLNPTIIGLIKSRGGFTSSQGIPTAVPLGSKINGPSTTIVNLASRVQVYNSDVYYSKPSHGQPQDVLNLHTARDEETADEVDSVINTLPITDVASLPKTYYTLFTYYYTLHDGDKSTYSQRSEVISNIATDSEPFLGQSFSNTIDKSGYLTLSPEKEYVNLGSRAAGGMTTEVNLELRTLVHFDNLRNVVLDRNGISPSLVEVLPTETRDVPSNNYLEPGDAEVQDQNTYPQTVPIEPSFTSGSSQLSGVDSSKSLSGETPEIPQNMDVVRTQPLRGHVRVASTKVQRPGALRSGVFVPRPGVRVRVRPVTSRREPSSLISRQSDLLRLSSPLYGGSSITGPDSEVVTISTDDLHDESHDLDPEEDEEEGAEDEEDIDEEEEYTTEENVTSEEPTTEDITELTPPQGRRRLKITIRRPTGSSAVRPTRTRPRFYVVTRTGSGAPVRSRINRPVSVKISRRPKPSERPRFETYTTVTSVPVIFGLSTTFRNAIVTSSSLVPPEGVVVTPTPSKTLVLTYFTTTTYTVPFTVSGETSFTTFEETNSRVVTETVESDADLSFVSTTILEDFDLNTKIVEGSEPADFTKAAKTLSPVQVYNNVQTLANQLNIGSRQSLVTKVSNGVTLIVASDGDIDQSEPVTGTLQPTTLTDALLMMDKDITTFYEPRTFYTTFTYFTTFFSGDSPSTLTSEQVVTNVYTVPVTQPIKSEVTNVDHVRATPVTVIDTMEQLVSTTLYTTHTFYATLFNGSETIVTPIEELQSVVISSTETYTVTKTIEPSVTTPPEIRTVPSEEPSAHTRETTLYKTLTNFVTLFRGPESIVSPLEEIVSEVITLTLDGTSETRPTVESTIPLQDLYTTRTIQATNTHYVTLFSSGQQILSSITEVAPSVITELVRQYPRPTISTISLDAPSSSKDLPLSTIEPSSASSSAQDQPSYQDLVPSVRTQYTTLTYFTTLFQDSSTILSSREEIATSYITLFVPVPASGVATTYSVEDEKASIETETVIAAKEATSVPSVVLSPTTEVLTFYTTYTYYTTLFRGTETIISDSETVVTQYVTIETTPTEAVHVSTTSSIAVHLTDYEQPDVGIHRTSVTSLQPSVEFVNVISVVSSMVDDNKSSAPGSGKESGSTEIHPEKVSASILTGIPTTDENGATHILFTDFIVPESTSSSPKPVYTSASSATVTPALPEDALSSSRFRPTSSTYRFGTTKLPTTSSEIIESSDESQTRETASDMATTRVTDANLVTHLPLHPTTSIQSGGSQTFGLKPGAVIDLSDVLSNTNLVGNLGDTIKDIVNLFAVGNRDRNRNISDPKLFHDVSNIASPAIPSGGIPVSHVVEPLYIPIGAIGRGTQSPHLPFTRPDGLILKPSTYLTGFTPVSRFGINRNTVIHEENLKALEDKGNKARTSIVFGTNTIFIEPSKSVSKDGSSQTSSAYGSDRTMFILTDSGRILSSRERVPSEEVMPTPVVVTTGSTSIITGIETIFFGVPNAPLPPPQGGEITTSSVGTSSIVGVETIFFDKEDAVTSPSTENSQITGETTIFGSFPIQFGSESASPAQPTSFTETSSGDTTIFFPLPEENTQQRPSSPGTRYVTSVESVTLTLTLTTSSVYQSQDTSVTVTSVFTTTIPPRTFVSTIIGSRTILGTQPEPTEPVQVVPTTQPSESTTTVTTTTLIFNSIATTVVRTLVIPTKALKPTGVRDGAMLATETIPGDGQFRPPSPKPATQGRKPIQLFRSPNRPTAPPTTRPGPTGPPLKLFPTRPSTTSTNPPPPKPATTQKTGFRKPGKALIPVTDGCPRECNLKNKEVCKQNHDRSWSCQCRPGFFKKQGFEECRDIKSYTVLVRVLPMGGNDVVDNQDLTDTHSSIYQNLTTTARKAVDEAYKLSSVGDDYVNANVLGVSTADRRKDGVLVNLTVTLTGDNPTSEDFLKDELAQSLEASASEAIETNATVVSAVIQKVEDVQDFDECADDSYNDCSRSSECINLPGTYTCECKLGYQDLEPLLPGRICSGEIKDCDFCNNRGVCIMTEDDQKFCRCYRMYLGKQCEINGLVLAIALPIALALLILTMFCFLCGCRRLRRRRSQNPKQNVFKGMVPPLAGTLDRKAMIMDSSSESSNDHAKANHAYDGFGDDAGNATYRREGRGSRRNSIEERISDDYGVPTVVIPRARHHHSKQVNHPTQPNYHRRPYDDQW